MVTVSFKMAIHSLSSPVILVFFFILSLALSRVLSSQADSEYFYPVTDYNVSSWRGYYQKDKFLGDLKPHLQRPLPDIHSYLHELQFPLDCNAAPLLLWEYVNNGMGCEIHWLQAALTVAASLGRTLVVHGHWTYADPDSHYCAPYLLPSDYGQEGEMNEERGLERAQVKLESMSSSSGMEETLIPKINFNQKLTTFKGSREYYFIHAAEKGEKIIGRREEGIYPKTAFDCYFAPLSSCGAAELRKEEVCEI